MIELIGLFIIFSKQKCVQPKPYAQKHMTQLSPNKFEHIIEKYVKIEHAFFTKVKNDILSPKTNIQICLAISV